jgi:hypothetical protein
MSSTTTQQPPMIREDEHIAERYADGIAECTFLNGVLHISFWTLRTDCAAEPPKYYRKVTTRVVLPIAGAMELQDRITNMLNVLEAQGTIKRPVASGLQVIPGPQTLQ